jgi:hypothetical protein
VKARGFIVSGSTRTWPRSRRGHGALISLMSISSALPSHLIALGPISSEATSRRKLARRRSVIAHLAPRGPYSATFIAQ